jgi:hypothetical protein
LFNCVKAAIDQSSDAGAGKTKLDVALSWLHTLETSDMFHDARVDSYKEDHGLFVMKLSPKYNVRVRSSRSFHADVMGLLISNNIFAFSDMVDGWYKLHPAHFHDLEHNHVKCQPEEFSSSANTEGWVALEKDGDRLLIETSANERYQFLKHEFVNLDSSTPISESFFDSLTKQSSSRVFLEALELFRLPIHQFILDELFASVSSYTHHVPANNLRYDSSYVPQIGEILLERLFDSFFRESVSSKIDALFQSDFLVDIFVYSLNFASKLSNSSLDSPTRGLPVETEFVVGCKVALSPEYEACDDASSGPLHVGDIGTLIEDDGSSKPYRVEFSGQRWWYTSKALTPIAHAAESRLSACNNTIMEWSISLFRTLFSGYLSSNYERCEKASVPLDWKKSLDNEMHRLLQNAQGELKQCIQFSYDCSLLCFCVEHECFSDASLLNIMCGWFKDQPRFVDLCKIAQQSITKRIQNCSLPKLLSEFATLLLVLMNNLSKKNISQFDSEWVKCQQASVTSTLFRQQLPFYDESSVFSQSFGTNSVFCEGFVLFRGDIFPVLAELSSSRLSFFQDVAKLKIVNWFKADEHFSMVFESNSDIVIRCHNVEGKSVEVVLNCSTQQDLKHWIESYKEFQASRKQIQHGTHATWDFLHSACSVNLEPSSVSVLFDFSCHYMSSLVISSVGMPNIRSAIRFACKWMSNNGHFLFQTMFNWVHILESHEPTSLSNITFHKDGVKFNCMEDIIFKDSHPETLQICLLQRSFSGSSASKLFYEIQILELPPHSSLRCGWRAEHSDGSQLTWYADGIRQRSSFPLFNKAGNSMKLGSDSLLFCSQKFGVESVESCRPNRGQQCPDCTAYAAPPKYDILKWNQGDVIGIAADLDNQKLFVSINGSPFDESALFCDGPSAPNRSMHLIPYISGKSAKIKVNFGECAFKFHPVDFAPFSWTSGSVALSQTFKKLFSDVFLEELAKVILLDWAPSSSLCQGILRVICDSHSNNFCIKQIQRSLLLDIERFESEPSVVCLGTSLFRSVLNSVDTSEYLAFHILRETAFQLLKSKLLEKIDMHCHKFDFKEFFSCLELCVSSLQSLVTSVGAARTQTQSHMIANVTFCLINSLNLDPSRVTLRSGKFA